VVYVTTLNNSVYPFDADDGSILWQAQYGTPTSFASLCHDGNFQLVKLHAVDPATGQDRPGSPVTIVPSDPTGFLPRYQMSLAGLALSAAGDTVYVALGSTGCLSPTNRDPAITATFSPTGRAV
jgi:hypothetical protein